MPKLDQLVAELFDDDDAIADERRGREAELAPGLLQRVISRHSASSVRTST
jgi:hypothetical protein